MLVAPVVPALLPCLCASRHSATAFHITCYPPVVYCHHREQCRLVILHYGRRSCSLAAPLHATLRQPYAHCRHVRAAACLAAGLGGSHARPAHSQTPHAPQCAAAGQPAGLAGSVAFISQPHVPHAAPRARLCATANPSGLAGLPASAALLQWARARCMHQRAAAAPPGPAGPAGSRAGRGRRQQPRWRPAAAPPTAPCRWCCTAACCALPRAAPPAPGRIVVFLRRHLLCRWIAAPHQAH